MMQSQNLSSNWKALQATLQGENSSGKPSRPEKRFQQKHEPAKRDNHSGEPPRQEQGLKKRKALPSPTTRNRRPAVRASDTPDDASDLASFAAEHDISVPQQTIASSFASADRPNAGLTPGISIGKFVALDCEMVGIGGTGADESSVLARVSVVDWHGRQVYDSFVKPRERVTDWRTSISGVGAWHMSTARTLEEVQASIAGLLDGRILVGHGIRHDLQVLLLSHPRSDIRDTSRHPPFRKLAGGKTPGLKKLARSYLGWEIQTGTHSSIEDARATMMVFRQCKEAFEAEHSKKFPTSTRQPASEDGTGSRKQKKKKKQQQRKGKR
ncbi:MAG: 3'-5' exonuclease [Thelocarpon impressellum]|nr:MAG: 3'-5' exonuclease [Thelocarpon impressellum]